MNFSASAKWILAGEHSILRGYRAVSIPRTDLKLKLEFSSMSSGDLSILPVEATQAILTILNRFKALKDVQIEKPIQGNLRVSSEIPFGAGLGSSAALCLVIVRWLSHFFPIKETEVCTLATLLENEFHGQSSGIDVATIYCAEPIRVQLLPNVFSGNRSPQIQKLGIKTLPQFTFHDTGLRASTRKCIEKVQSLGMQNPSFGKEIDEMMNQAATDAEQGLIYFSGGEQKEGLAKITRSMKLGQECFQNWDLAPQSVMEQVSNLYSQGALAVKLTGSGGGGMLVALWSPHGQTLV